MWLPIMFYIVSVFHSHGTAERPVVRPNPVHMPRGRAAVPWDYESNLARQELR